MPIYEYRCGDCGHELEALQKLSDPKLTTCPECGKEALTKLVSASAFVLKGTGWYQTDFRDKDKPKAGQGGGQSDGSAADSGSDQGAAKGDKTDSKSESKSAGNEGQSDSNKSDSKPNKKAAGE